MAWPNSQTRRVKLTIQNTQVPGTLSDFPVLITRANLPNEMCSPTSGNRAQSGGGDIRAAQDDASTTRYAIDVQRFEYDSSDGAGDGNVEIWVKIPSVSSTVDTDFWLGYNTSGTTSADAVTDTYGRNAVWSGFEAVYHMNEDPSGTAPQITDATGNGHNLTSSGTMTSGDLVAGAFAGGRAIDFDGTDDRLANTAGYTPTGSDRSVLLWFKSDTGFDENAHRQLFEIRSQSEASYWVLSKRNDNASSNFDNAFQHPVWRDVNGTGGGTHYRNTNKSSTNWPTGSWRHIAVRQSGTTAVSRHNGAAVSYSFTQLTTDNFDTSSSDINIGDGDTWSGNFDGLIDEVWIAESVIGPDFSDAAYNNQNSPSTFTVEGTPENTGAGSTVNTGTVSRTRTANSFSINANTTLSISTVSRSRAVGAFGVDANTSVAVASVSRTITPNAFTISSSGNVNVNTTTVTRTLSVNSVGINANTTVNTALVTRTRTANALTVSVGAYVPISSVSRTVSTNPLTIGISRTVNFSTVSRSLTVYSLTITDEQQTNLIDGQTTKVINTAFGEARIYYSSDGWWSW